MKHIQFTNEEISKITATFSRKSLNNDTQKSFQDALADMVKWSCGTFYLKTAKDRKKLERINKTATKLKDEISDVLFALRLIENGEAYLTFLNQLSAIERRSKSELKSYDKKQGRKIENWPLRLLINRLAEIYKSATNKKPTLTKASPAAKIVNAPGGAFFRFASTFLVIAQKKFPAIKCHKENTLVKIIEAELYSTKSM